MPRHSRDAADLTRREFLRAFGSAAAADDAEGRAYADRLRPTLEGGGD